MKPAHLLLTTLLLAVTTAMAAPRDDAMQAYDKGNYAVAAQLLAPLAKEGDAIAQLRLGMLNFYGKGVKENEAAAMALWEKSAAQGNTEAMFQLGKAYTFGSQANRNTADPDVEAAKWYYQAASAGHAEAQFSLGLMFLVGKGVVEDRTEANRWIRMAADQGQPEAKRFLAGPKQ